MPRTDGFELMERVRALATTAAISIIVVSADGAPEARERARRLGATNFLVKSYSPAAVREAVEDLLHETQRRDIT